ncbi:MAG: alpha-galactosidase [Lachnospiraceae bacterium]|nr:alpha-galactosidase [Lachnospiraceae bacterium]
MIDIRENEGGRDLFILNTQNTSYVFKLLENGQLEHLYYGPAIEVLSSDGLCESHVFPPGNSSVYSSGYGNFSPEDIRYEYSAPGKGDIRETMIGAVYADGSRSIDPVYVSHEVMSGKPELKLMPSSYGKDDEVQSLIIKLKDRNGSLCFELIYSVFEKTDVICRRLKIVNEGEEKVRLLKALSMQLDMDPDAYVFHSFTGAWAREMRKSDMPIKAGKISVGSHTGSSSNRANPFFMISKKGTTEDSGLCYGFNLVYSGNHYEAAERSAYGKLRVLNGLQPDGFEWILDKGECFETPEAVLSVSDKGFGGLSRQFHRFIREHIVRGRWQHKNRPVLLNSWEASYFDITESRLVSLAKKAKAVGIELLVMDDGWFGKRDDDTSSLGDWYVNKKKLPHGVKGLADKITELGLKFGIWVEPEMVNEDSELYRSHPDWAFKIPDKEHSTGRSQMFLDLSRIEVQDYIIDRLKELFSSAEISYVKWDMNRNFTDVYSAALPPERQGEAAHRYILGLYRIMQTLTKAFPAILFEGCASGGNRFDLGILSYFPQIWGSDDSDAIARTQIQEGYSYGYPQSTYTAHVSDVPNHQTLRRTPPETRFNVAASAVLGYECNLSDLSADDLEVIKDQVALYKKWRSLLQYGEYYRIKGFKDADDKDVLENDDGVDALWCIVSPDGKKAVCVVLQQLVRPNTQWLQIRLKGLDKNGIYRIRSRVFKTNLKDFGGLVNYVAPVHVKQDGAIHNILAKFVKMETEKEDHIMSGSALMNAGLKLKSAFSGSGYSDEMRFYPDFASRMFFIEEEKDERADKPE